MIRLANNLIPIAVTTPRRIPRVLFVILIGLLISRTSPAEEASIERLPRGVHQDHPLLAVQDLVEEQLAKIRETIDDYSCRLVKRERIDGLLQEYRFIDVKVRRSVVEGGERRRPFAVFIHYLSPSTIAGRRVLYVQGENNDRMLVRQTGPLLGNVTLKISLNSVAARRESLQPISDLGFERMAIALLATLRQHMQADPSGVNTRVDYIPGAKLGGRVCTCIRVTHRQSADNYMFHKAEVFLDNELELPIRVVSYDWAESEQLELPLISEYIYTRLRLNVGLTDDDFAVERLQETD